MPEQSVAQHTPSKHQPLGHCAAAVQASPGGRGWQVPAARGALQISSLRQLLAQQTPSAQIPLVQLAAEVHGVPLASVTFSSG